MAADTRLRGRTTRLSPISMPEAAMTSAAVYRTLPVTSTEFTRKNTTHASTTAAAISRMDKSL